MALIRVMFGLNDQCPKLVSQVLKPLAAVGCTFVLVNAAWFWENPSMERSAVVLIGTQQETDPAANAYACSAVDDGHLAKLLIADPRFGNIPAMSQMLDPGPWLKDHLHVRIIQGDRVVMITTARPYELNAGNLDSVMALASDSLIADALDNGVALLDHSFQP